MANLTTDMSNKVNGSDSDFKNKIMSEGHQLEKLAQNAGERVGAIASSLANTTADSMKSSREFVRDNPIKGVAIAAAAGLFAGSLLTMVMRSRKN